MINKKSPGIRNGSPNRGSLGQSNAGPLKKIVSCSLIRKMQSSQKGLAIVFLPDENEVDVIIPQ